MGDETKACPRCGQSIQAEAVLCRFCKADLGAPAPEPEDFAPPPPRPKKSFPVWILVLILCCCGGLLVVPIIAAIAIPGLLASQRAANERNASASLRTLAAAEADFRANDRDGNQANDFWTGDVSRLYFMKVKGEELRLIDRSIAEADDNPAEPVHQQAKAGYRFAAVDIDAEGEPYDAGSGRHPAKFAFCAYPETYPATGRMTFLLNENHEMWKKDTSGESVERWPRNPAAEGWQPLY